MTRSLSVPLAQCGTMPQSDVGGKARNLGRLITAGFTVPVGVCLTAALFRLVQHETELGTVITKEIHSLKHNPVLTGKALEKIRNTIQHIQLPTEVVAEISSNVFPLLAQGSVIVRSSAPDEDNHRHSHAGVYYSEGGITDISRVMSAIRKCWASLFLGRAFLYKQGNVDADMAVIIQQYIQAELSGVLFTVHPLKHNNDMLIEVNQGGNEGITAGYHVSRCLGVSKDAVEITDLPQTLTQALMTAAHEVENMLDGPVDIEWLWAKGTLQLLQARLITSAGQSTGGDLAWAKMEDVDRVYRLELGMCQRLFQRHLLKKVWYRTFCAERGINTFQVIYVVYSLKGLENRGNELIEAIQMPYVYIYWGKHKRFVSRDNVINALYEGHQNNVLSNEEYCCANITERMQGDVMGYASCIEGGRILIEAFPCNMYNRKTDALVPTVYLLDGAGNIMRQTTEHYSVQPILNIDCGRWETIAVPEFTLAISPDQLQQIFHASTQLAGKFGEVRLEWQRYQHTIYVIDLSIETRPIGITNDVVLSPGSATGTVVKISDIAAFDKIADMFDVSVVNYADQDEEEHEVEPIERIRCLSEQLGSLIVVAKYPSVGLITLIQYVQGFIFTQAPMLCHTAIVLREHVIPGIIVPDAEDLFTDGDQITISPAGFTIISKRS